MKDPNGFPVSRPASMYAKGNIKTVAHGPEVAGPVGNGRMGPMNRTPGIYQVFGGKRKRGGT